MQRVPDCSVPTRTHSDSVHAAVLESCDTALTNLSPECLINQTSAAPSQSEKLFMLVPVSARYCFVCFWYCLCKRKCAFPARGGSWISSALSARTQCSADNCCRRMQCSYTDFTRPPHFKDCCGLIFEACSEEQEKDIVSLCLRTRSWEEGWRMLICCLVEEKKAE